MREIKFISYDGKFPNLCSGILVLEIDGQKIYGKYCLSSGGSVWFSDDWEDHVEEGPWTVMFDEFFKNEIDPNDWQFYRNNEKISEDYFSEEDKKVITELVNENIEHGCCGGCV